MIERKPLGREWRDVRELGKRERAEFFREFGEQNPIQCDPDAGRPLPDFDHLWIDLGGEG